MVKSKTKTSLLQDPTPLGRPRRKKVQKDSKDRRLRRLPQQLGDMLVLLINSMLQLHAIPKVPLINASDALALVFFVDALTPRWSMGAIALAFLVAHQIRTPALLTKLLKHLKSRSVHRASEAVTILHRVLGETPFSKQTSGLPYWIGTSRFHTGAVAARKWFEPAQELGLLATTHEMVLWATGSSRGSAVVMQRLQRLPGLDTYGYHM